MSSNNAWSFTYTLVKSVLKISRISVDVLSISPQTRLAGSVSGSFFIKLSHLEIESSKSFCNSATPFPSETVLMITPKFLGLILSIIFFKRLRSVLLLIFLEMEITLEKGTSTVYLPAIERSELNLGPLVEMGSLAICTGTSKFLLTTSEIFPALLISASNLKLSNKVPCVPLRLIFVSFIRD
ncbi:hypothetical protein D3C85_1052070 [compost metagenome]